MPDEIASAVAEGVGAAVTTPNRMSLRPALRYHGGKWRAAPWIIGFLPVHECYVEPFGGGASVLLRKERSSLEVYNDLDGNVVNFFRVLRERPDELVRALYWTPFAHAEQKLSLEPSDDPLEAARRLYVRSHMTISGPTAQWNSGWRRQKFMSRGRSGKSNMTPAAKSFMNVEYLYRLGERLRGVTIEETDALTLIPRYDHARAVFYVDPPYVASSRKRWNAQAYRHEMTDEQHVQMAQTLHAVTGMVVLSGYNCDLYRELFGDWQRHDRGFRTNGNRAELATESLWLNPAAEQALQQQAARAKL